MATEIALRSDDSLHLEAVSTDQMISAHEQMRAWIVAKVVQLRKELDEEIEVRDIAERNKWAVTRHKRNIRNLERRIDFFMKIDTALEAGYVIVPNFNMDIFAIRTDRAQPALNATRGGSWNVRQQAARVLPKEEGEYHSPNTLTQTDEFEGGRSRSYAVGNWLDVEFPFALAKPMLMNRTAEALALQCFDEVGVVRDTAVKGDPYIVGRIRNPGRRNDISFFIGWFFDPSSL